MLPWAGFSTMLWQRNEMPLQNTDTLWTPTAIIDDAHPLGAAKDDIQLLGFTFKRQFEAYWEPSRHALLVALIGTIGLYVDWQRPVPDSRQAYFESITTLERVGRVGTRSFNAAPGDETGERRRLRLTFIGQ